MPKRSTCSCSWGQPSSSPAWCGICAPNRAIDLVWPGRQGPKMSQLLRIETHVPLCKAPGMIHTLVNFGALDPARPIRPGPMGRVMISKKLRIAGPALALVLTLAASAGAQVMPPPGAGGPPPGVTAPPPPPGVMPPPGVTAPTQNPVCARLEAQLAALDREGRGEQIQRYENAVQAQQTELDRTVAQARRTGCEGSGFFLFGRSQPPQCDELNNRVQRMRSNLDRLNADLQQLQSGRGAVEGQRQQIRAALGQNDCGPQYRSAAAQPQPARPRGFFEALFGGGGSSTPGGASSNAPFGSGDLTPSDQSSTYRTICVRTCDGFYFPVSYSAGQAKFRDDEDRKRTRLNSSQLGISYSDL